LASLLSALGVSLSSPATIIVIVIEFLLGLGVGYVLAKGLKYVLAFFLLLIVGELLNIWSIGALDMKSLASSVYQRQRNCHRAGAEGPGALSSP
jgi:hypothetical protein